MKHRRFLGLGVAALLITAPLAACGDAGSEGGGPTQVTYWLWQDDATDLTWDDLAAEFNSTHDDVQVTLQTIPLDQYQDRLLTAAASGSGPDAARSKDWWLGQFAPQGMFADLTEYVDAWDGQGDVIDSLWATGQLPGEDSIYMLPHQYVTLYMYYRTDFFAAAGLDAPQTQQDVLDAAAVLTDPAAGRYGIDIRGGGGGQDQWLAWMFAGGADVVNDSGEVVLDDETAVEVNQRYLSIMTELNAAPPGSVTANFAQVQTNFAAGTTAMMIHHPGSLATMRETFGDDLGVVPMPTAAGGEPSTLGSMSGNVILADSDRQDAAWEWLSWLSETEAMETMSTSPQGQLPVLESVASSEAFTGDPALQIALEASRTAQSWPALPGVAQLAAKDWQTILQPAFLGEKTSAESLQEMAELLRED